MANVENLKIGNDTYGIRDKNTLRSLDSTLVEEVTTYGTYDGIEVENGEVFTNESGKFQEFSKYQSTGDTTFSEKSSFPNSNAPFWATKITRSVGGVDEDVYMAVGDTNKCYVLNNGTWGLKGTLTKTATKPVLYKDGVWVNGFSYSENDGETWQNSTASSGLREINFGLTGDYFYTTYPSGGAFGLSSDGKVWTDQYSNLTEDMCYIGNNTYIRFRGSGNANPYYVETSTTPMDGTSWTTLSTSGLGNYPMRLKKNGTRLYAYCRLVNNTSNCGVYYSDDNGSNWVQSQTTFANDIVGNFLFVGDLVFVERTSTNEMWVSKDKGETFEPITGGNGKTTSVGYELWEIYNGKIYSLNPNPYWVYSLTDIGGGSGGSLTDIATAGTGIKFAGASDQNFTINGYPTITDGIYSNIDNGNNITADYKFQPSTNTWEFVTKVTIGSDTSSGSFFFGRAGNGDKYPQIGIEGGKFYMAASYSGSNWDINTHGNSVTAYTTYWIKVSYDGSYYKIEYKTNEEDAWSEGLSVSSNSALYVPDVKMAVGWYYDADYYFRGSIDLNETSMTVNDVVVWTPYTTLDKPAITADIGSGASAPTSSTVGYIGKLYVTDGGAVYICTGVSGSTYTWSQITTS